MYRSQRPCFRQVWPRVTSLPHLRLLCSWVVNLELQVTRVPLQSGVFPRPKSSGAHGAFSSIRYQAWQQTKNWRACVPCHSYGPAPPFSYSPVRPRKGSVLAGAHGGAIRPFRTSPSRNRKTYTGEFSRAVVRRNCAVVRNGRCGRGNRGESECWFAGDE